MVARIHCDGGSRGNPGPAAAGSVLLDGAGKVIDSAQEYLGIATNNLAEYQSVLLGIELMRKHQLQDADFYLDSQLVVRQLSGQYKVKHPDMQRQFAAVQTALQGLEVRFHHVMREHNKEADSVVNECLDNNSTK